MESTEHLENPGYQISDSKSRETMAQCTRVKTHLKELFGEAGRSLLKSKCIMSDELRGIVDKRSKNFDYETFPGAQPISMERKHLDGTMSESQYLCCEKTDGVRYLCVVGYSSVFLIDRNYTIFKVKMEPLPKIEVKSEFVHVFDGELIKDKGDDTIKYFIFDSLQVNGLNVMNQPFQTRLLYAKNHIIKKLRVKEYIELTKNRADEMDDDEEEDFEDLKVGGPEESKMPEIRVYLKDFFDYTHTKILHQNIMPKLDHGNDGIVYTMNNCPYYPGTCHQIIKWKPSSMNSVDFSLKLITSYSDTQYIWGLYTRTYDTPELLYDCLFLSSASENEKWRKTIASNPKKPIILECAYRPDLADPNIITYNKYKRTQMTSDLPKADVIRKAFKFEEEVSEKDTELFKGGWVIERQRTDKEFPNSLQVTNNIKMTIMDPVTVEQIIESGEKFMRKREALKRPAQVPEGNGHKRQRN